MASYNKSLFCLLLFFILAGGAAVAQTREQKKQAKEATKKKEVMNEALKQRYERDQRFASDQRAAFNRSSWIGAKLGDLIQNWGPPTRVVEDGAGGKIAVYDRSSSSSGGTYTPGYTVYNGFGNVVDKKESVDTRWSSQYAESTAVYADKNGIITKVTFDNDYKRN